MILPCNNVNKPQEDSFKPNTTKEAKLSNILVQLHYFNTIFRSSRPEVFCKKGVFGNFAKITGKHPCQSLFFNKVANFNFILKKTLAQVFSFEFCEIS